MVLANIFRLETDFKSSIQQTEEETTSVITQQAITTPEPTKPPIQTRDDIIVIIGKIIN